MTEEEWERRAFENEIMAAKRGMVHVYLFEVPNEVPAGLRLVHKTSHLGARTAQVVIMGSGTGWRRTRRTRRGSSAIVC